MTINPIWQPPSQQRIFRQLVEAMANPGCMVDLERWLNGDAAYRGVLASLLDGEVTLADDHALLPATDWPLLQAKEVTVDAANYVLCDGSRSPDFQPKLGTLTCPDEAATLIICVKSLGQGGLRLRLSGPGIERVAHLALAGLNPAWLSAREQWNAAFPLGVDILLTDERCVVGLPRTTRVEAD